MAAIEEIEGIGPALGQKLASLGVRTTEALLERAGTRVGRKHLADQVGVTEQEVLKWVNRADLMRIKGVGEEYSDLLEAAGVDSPRELAHRVPAMLHGTLERLNAEKKLVRRLPTLKEVERWVQEAKSLPQLVAH
jgi:predicted flap endonuclease-1-like 5' DNA nuclease